LLDLHVSAKGAILSLRLDFCPRSMAEFFCVRDHYSGNLPAGRMQTIGAWEDSLPVGTFVFSRGACKDLGTRFGFDQTEAVELTRAAFGPHRTPITQSLAIALRMLKAANPSLQVVISFADPVQSHNGHQHDGAIYRAGNWWFLGMTSAEAMLRLGGVLRHRRTVISKHRTGAVPWLREHVDPTTARVIMPPKFRFAMPLTDTARERLRPHMRPYPGRPKEQAPAGPAGLAGATPSRPLHGHDTEVAHA
jgi:hypothetical protein